MSAIYDQFAKRLIRSGWRGIVSEAGLGVPLQDHLLRYPGASNALFASECSYSLESRIDTDQRVARKYGAVSRELVTVESRGLFRYLVDLDSGHKLPFAYAVSGAYKGVEEKGETHMWGALTYATGKFDPGYEDGKQVYGMRTDSFHAWIPKHLCLNRSWAIDQMLVAHQWFLDGTLLAAKLGLPDYPLAPPVYIDAVNSGKMSMEDCAALHVGPSVKVFEAKPGSKNIIMRRPHDIIRDPLVVVRGSFNPIHTSHLDLINRAVKYVEQRRFEDYPPRLVLEISLSNFWGKEVELTNLVHRIRMLTDLGFTVVISRCPTFEDLTRILLSMGSPSITYYIGADVYNAIVNRDDAHVHLTDSRVSFCVAPRGKPLIDKPVFKINYGLLDLPDTNVSSTGIRSALKAGTSPFNIPELPFVTADYIFGNKLYVD